MAKRKPRKPPDVISDADLTGRLGHSPYQQQKGMANSPTDRDRNKRDRKRAKRDIQDGKYE